jgi:SAM-dependent methyltransferase
MTRNDKILAGLSRDMHFIEIGASFNPIVPKREGWKVWTIDHATREGLVTKYTGHPDVDVTKIEEVDFVWTTGPIHAVLPAAMYGKIDAFIASHVIEHIPDLIGLLNSLATVLSPGGIIALAVPDKRFCFDYFRPHSTTGQVIDAYCQADRNRHRRGALFDHFAYFCTMDSRIVWGQHPVGQPELTHLLSDSMQMSTSPPSAGYVDCHAWQFTPTSFELIIFELAALGLIDFRIKQLFPTDGYEFIVQLQKGHGDVSMGREVNPRRLEMLARIVEEIGEQVDYLRASPAFNQLSRAERPHLPQSALGTPEVAANPAKPPAAASAAGGPTGDALLYAIDRFSVFQGTLCLSGWAHHPTCRITGLMLRLPSGRRCRLTNCDLPSPDVADVHGPNANACRFDQTFHIPQDASNASAAELTVELDGDSAKTLTISGLGAPRGDPAHMLQQEFANLLQQMKPADTASANGGGSLHFLEIGSRARSGMTRRQFVPEGWRYTGLDVMPGPNVDVVGDTHCLSRLFPAQKFSAVMSFAVFEHLLMPWKVVIELNKVLRPGAVGMFFAPQTWPIHDVPWDFWRYSDEAWHAILNQQTGFEIIDAKMGEPVFSVPQKLHPAVDFGDTPGYLNSTVVFRKTGETTLEWPVDLGQIISTRYPKGEVAPPS